MPFPGNLLFNPKILTTAFQLWRRQGIRNQALFKIDHNCYFISLCIFIGCDGGSEDANDNVANANLAGTWEIYEIYHAEGCGGGTFEDEYIITITQEGSQIVIDFGDGYILDGVVNGRNVTWIEEFDDTQGHVVANYEVVVAEGDNSFQGSSNMTRTPGICNATSEITGARMLDDDNDM